MKTLSELTREHVMRGFGLLVAEAPGWFNRVDLDTLDMYSVSNCIAGQAFPGGFEGACKATRWQTHYYGFSADDDLRDLARSEVKDLCDDDECPRCVFRVDSHLWYVLHDAWVAVITDLRESAA